MDKEQGEAKRVTIHDSVIDIRRTTGGVPEIFAQNDFDLARGLGYAHAHDRLVQMMLMRIAGHGRLSECLKSTPELLEIDLFMRGLGMVRVAQDEARACEGESRKYAQAYCDGVNAYLKENPVPLELKLVKYNPDPWTLEDLMLTFKLMGYIGLAQTQQDLEKFIIQSVKKGLPLDRLKELFAPHLEGLTEEIAELIRKTKIKQGLVPEGIEFLLAIPSLKASNNWALSGTLTQSGQPYQCNDPHLEVNRLPSVFYEAILRMPGHYRLGITVPGLPGIVMGRNENVSFGFTYGYMDTIDYFIEEVKDGQVREGRNFVEPRRFSEKVLRKGQHPIEVTRYETSRGVLETNLKDHRLEDGFYLSRAWSGYFLGATEMLDCIYRLQSVQNVKDAQKIAAKISVTCNWCMADRAGNIGYQQSGYLPARTHSGLYPLPGWKPENHWKGRVSPDDLMSEYNPERGFVATANNEIQRPGKPLVMNAFMGSYRVDRIREKLSQKKNHSIEEMQALQCDVYSKQAELFMPLFRRYIETMPASGAQSLILGWDYRYDSASRGATLFEEIYHNLLQEVLGQGFFGADVWKHLVESTSLMVAYYSFFDRLILSGDLKWFGGTEEKKEALFKTIIARVLGNREEDQVQPWGEKNQMLVKNIFFSGKLPKILGFDYGPIALQGNRATPAQMAFCKFGDREIVSSATWRYVTNLGEDSAFTVIAGGPSGRRWSKVYACDFPLWETGQYKKLSL